MRLSRSTTSAKVAQTCWGITIVMFAIACSVLPVTGAFQAFRAVPSRTQISGNTKPLLFNDNNKGDDSSIENEEESNGFDDFLDRQFFDPEKVTEDDPAPVRWFANLVKNDYATAETLFAGLLFLFLVVVSQELLRMQIYGMEGYVPFSGGVRPGQLF